jgi:site-specific recombinase
MAYATPAPAYRQPAAHKKQGMAVASMVLGILSVLIGWIPVVGWFTGFPMALLAVILGAVAIGQANKKPDEFGGKGMAITGLVLGIVTLALALLFWIVVGSFIAAFT